MSAKSWSREEVRTFAIRYGLEVRGDEDIDRMMVLGTRVATVGESIKRMPSKGNEPCSVFKVPQ